MIRLTHKSWTAFKGVSPSITAPTKATTTATTFTVSWNCTNFLMESYTFLPHNTAFSIELKLSSMRMISAADLATSVPMIPIANPTSACLREGASLVPSPVTATTSPSSPSRVTRMSLSSGEHLAIIWSFGINLSISSVESFLNFGPSMAIPSVRIPHLRAMFLAVRMLSPVSILTVIPASLHCLTEAGTSGLRGSSIPTIPIRVKSVSMVSSLISALTFSGKSL
mmetsp:Transcript_23640/g.33085  ORF Transcript_23640/g.33085 Transcript_23640/m.33085 type:complete len:225 (+) Transcript_23640:2-676(+)